MKVSSVTFNQTNTKYPVQKQQEQPLLGHPIMFKSVLQDSGYGLSLLHIHQMNKLKEETKQFPQDIVYREQLMLNAGLNPRNQHKLRAIIGPQEIKSIITDFDSKPEVYNIGEKWTNVNNLNMRANIHIHTTASDGELTVTELLDKAAEYANNVKRYNPKIKEPFVIAITDHDTTESAKEAIKVISEKPMKYANLRVILGAEITTFNNIGLDKVEAPTNVHVLAYGIDPNEKTFSNFIDKTKAKKSNLQELMVESANRTYKKHFGKDNFYSVGEAKHQYNTVNKNIIGIYNGVETYFATKAAVENVILTDKHLVKELKKHNAPTTTEPFMELLSEYHSGLDGNNKVQSPMLTLPEFVNKLTGIKEEKITNILDKAYKKDKLKSFADDLRMNLQEYKTTVNPKYDYMPNFSKVYKALNNQPNAILGVAHPVDTLKNVKDESKKYDFLTDLYDKFKSDCKEKAQFTEAYYQSYKPGRKEFNQLPETQKFFGNLKKVFKILRTGSADTHGLNIFIR